MLNIFVPVARQALNDPREAAGTLLAMGVPRDALWPAFFLLITLSVIGMAIISAVSPPTPVAPVPPPPVILALITAIISGVSVWLVWKVGQAMGGTGRFDEALLLTVFLQAIIFAGQVVEFMLLLFLPLLAGLFSIAMIGFAIWLNVNFIATLHGFTSLWRALGCVLLASLGAALVFFFLMTLTGAGVGVPQNV